MSNEITIDDLRNTCCLCLRKGEFDLLQQKVIIENEIINDVNTTEYESEECFEINAMDLFEIYQHTNIFNLSSEVKLICHSCLEELTVCYKFYRKIIRACEQKQHLLEAAQNQQTEELDDLFIKVQCDSKNEQLDTKTATENSFTENDRLMQVANVVHTQSELSTTLQSDMSVDVRQIYEPQTVTKEEESLAIGESNHSTDDCETTSFVESIIYQSDQEEENIIEEVILPVVKRPRLKFSREKVSGSCGPVQTPHEGASLVVTQFLPVKMKLVTDSLHNKNDVINESDQDLNTVDYAAVEFKSSNLQYTNNGEIVFENNVNYDDDSKEQVFACKYCPQAFSAAPYLIAHVTKCHVCKYCTKAFVKSLDLFVHIRQAHYQHKCAVCQKELSSQSNLRGHIKRVHGIRLPAQVALLDYKTQS